MASSVQVQFSASIKDLIDKTDQVKGAIESIKESADKTMEGFKQFAEVFGVAFSTEKIIEFVSQMAELGEQTERMSAILGVSTKSVQELGFIAQVTGGNSESLALSMERLQVNLQKAQNGTGPAAAGLNALGLSAKQLIGLPIDEQMNRIADAVSKFADGGNKTAIVMELLGRGGAQMIPVLDQGRAGLEELRQAADDSGAVMTTKTVQALSSVEHGLVTMKAAATGLGGTLVGEFSGAINATTHALVEFIGDLAALVSSGRLGEAAMAELSGAFRALGQNLSNTAEVLNDLVQLNWSKAVADWKAGGAQLAATAQETTDKVTDIVGKAKAEMQSLLSESETSGKPQAPASDVGGGKGKAATAELDGQLKLQQLKFQAVKDGLDSEVKLNQISAAEKFDILIGETEKEKQAELKLLQDKLELETQGSAQYAQIQAKMAETRQKYDNEERKDLQAKIQDYAKTYDQIGSTVLGAWNSQLKGLLAGTTTFGQAMKNIFADLALKLIEYFESMAVKWVATEAAKTVATTTGNAARVASDTAAEAATLPVRAAKFASDITSDAAAVFAGIFANLAPVLGPGAAGPAAAGSATVLAQLAAVPKLDVGGYVLSSGLAVIHKGETVTPASVVQGGGGGGGENHFHIHAWDTQTGYQAMLQNLPSFARELQRHMNQNPSYA